MLARLIAAASGGEAAPEAAASGGEAAPGLEESAAAARARRARRYKASKANADKQFKPVIKMVNKTPQENCTNLTFGHGNSSCKDTYHRFSQAANALDGVASEVVDKTKQTQSAIVRGLASHLKAVRQKLVDLFNKTSYVIVADVSDEASMWCRRSLTSDELRAAKAAAAKAKAATNKKIVCDRNVTKKTRVPCLNQVQNIRMEVDASNELVAFQLHSPTQVIAKGNWATMLRAKRKWSIQCCGKVGSRLQDDNSSTDCSLQKAADSVRYIGKCVCGDAASVNVCIDAREQEALQEQRIPGERIRTFCSNKCCSHQACLLNRVVYDEDDHASFLSRLSHILQNNRTLTSVLEKADLYVESIFEYHPIDAESMPTETHDWNRAARNILASSNFSDDEALNCNYMHAFKTLQRLITGL